MDKKKLQHIFNDFNKVNVLVIGDIMLDSYIFGSVSRISPEAPVPIVNMQQKENRPGGAANVAINLKALGANVSVCAVVGNDENGIALLSSLKKASVETAGIIKDDKRCTTSKIRIIANNHQMLRVDNETCKHVEQKVLSKLKEFVKKKIEKKQCNVVVFEDYDKGLLNETFISSIISLANKNKIPVIVDPKKDNFFHYKHVSLFKPNLKELNEGMNVNIEKNDVAGLNALVKKLNKKIHATLIMLTLSENGVLLFDANKLYHFKAHSRQIADVSGAGDTVISVAAVCLALNLSPEFIADLSNIAGGLVCEKPGVVPVDKKELFNEALRLINIQ